MPGVFSHPPGPLLSRHLILTGVAISRLPGVGGTVGNRVPIKTCHALISVSPWFSTAGNQTHVDVRIALFGVFASFRRLGG